MILRQIVFALLTAVFLLPSRLPAGGAYPEFGQLVLYQPNDVLGARLGDPQALADYVKRLEEVLRPACAFFSADTFYVVVAVRPGRGARVWFVSRSKRDWSSLRTKLQAVVPCAVSQGPVAFALCVKTRGGGREPEIPIPPIPAEWRAAAQGKDRLLVSDGFLDLVWPAK